ncbi:MAG: class I SAM-dependent methyltransferase [Patulibacter minatonensis]
MTNIVTGPGNHDQGPGGGAWFDRWATHYDSERRLLISPFDAYYAAAAEAASLLPEGARRTQGAGGGPIRVLELGAGTGLLTAALAESLPGAHFTLLDEAEGMLAQARDRFAGRAEGALETIVGDLLADLPDGPFDVIASGLAIHHLDPADQARTYAAARGRLAPGGVFVNAEQLHAPGPAWLEDHYKERELVHARAGGFTPEAEEQAWIRWSVDQHVDLEQHLRWLHEAGFTVVDCVFKAWRFAVVAGWDMDGA